MTVKKISKNPLRKQAEAAIKNMIVSARFTPGMRINIEHLATELGVSRTPVWQALKGLEAEGLVNHIPNRGVFMAQMTLEMAYDLYTVREPLEALAARLAATRISRREIKQLEKLLRTQMNCLESRDLIAYSISDLEFHNIIYAASSNWLLVELLENIKNRSRPFVCDVLSILSQLVEDHSEVIDAFKGNDPDRASAAMTRHNRRMKEQIQRARLAQGVNGNSSKDKTN